MLWKSYLRKTRGLSLPERTASSTGEGIPHDVRRTLEDFARHESNYRTLVATSWSVDEGLSQDWRRERVEMARILLDLRDQHDPRNYRLISCLAIFSVRGNL